MKNLELLVDAYEFQMAQTYLKQGVENKTVVFDMFYRTVPDGGSFAIAAGLTHVIDYIENLSFSQESIDFLRTKGFEDIFLDYLKDFKFSGDIRAVEEGTIVYPNTPMVQVIAPLIECQIIETYLLTMINYPTLIATKARRVAYAAQGAPIMEFGARRAHGAEASVVGARAAFIGGASSTSNVYADKAFGMPSVGTMAHSYVTFHDTEFEAFKNFAIHNPDNCVLLIDTYDTLKSGLPNAIRVHKEVLQPMGKSLKGIRLDSGDLAYLSKKVRESFTSHHMDDTLIYASNSLDEFTIQSLKAQGSCIDIYGVGERMITSKSSPTFGGVYKLVAVENEVGDIVPRIKVSEDVVKIITPAYKDLYRIYDADGHSVADLLSLHGEHIGVGTEYLDSDLGKVERVRVIEEGQTVKPLLVDIYKGGRLVYKEKDVAEIKEYVNHQLENEIWETELRLQNPSVHYVNHSKSLYDVKTKMIRDAKW